MSVYLNNQGAGTFGGEVWGAGDDANDGLSRAAPKLTANAAFAQYAAGGQDGESLVINDGTYAYTDNDGRWILSHASATVEFQNDLQTVVVFSGSNAQGFRLNGSTTEARSLTVGAVGRRGYISTDNVAKTNAVVISHNNAGSQRITFDWNAFIIPQIGVNDAQIGINLQASNIDATINGGTTAQGGGMIDLGASGTYQAVRHTPTVIHVSSIISIESWELNLRAPTLAAAGVINLTTNNEATTGLWSVSGVTGTAIDSGNSNVSYLVHMDNPPSGSYIEECNDISYTGDTVGRGVGMYQIVSPDFASPDCSIRNCRRNKLHSENGNGFVAIIGREGGDQNNDNGWIYGVDIECTVGDAALNSLHGLSHIGTLNGIRAYNRITGVSIGSLTKAGTALSFGNTITIAPGSGSENHLQAKGAEDGTEFFNETCIVQNGFDGDICQAQFDDTFSQQNSTNTIFRDIKVRMDSGDIGAGAEFLVIGEPGDTSTGSLDGMIIDDSVDLSLITNIASIAGVPIQSLADLNAHAAVRLAFQQSLPSGSSTSSTPSTSSGSGGGSGQLISSVFG